MLWNHNLKIWIWFILWSFELKLQFEVSSLKYVHLWPAVSPDHISPWKELLIILPCWWRDPLKLTYNHDSGNNILKIEKLQMSKAGELQNYWKWNRSQTICCNFLAQREVKMDKLKLKRKLLKFQMRKLMKSFIEFNIDI